GGERCVADGAGPVAFTRSDGGHSLNAFLACEGELLRAEGPGRPGAARRTFYLARATGRAARFVSVLEPVTAVPSVRGVRVKGSVIEVDTDQGVHRHAATAVGWEIETGGGRIRLAGARAPAAPRALYIALDAPTPAGRPAEGAVGYLIGPGSPDGGSVRSRGAGASPGLPEAVQGRWRRTPRGYRVTVAIAWPEWQRAHIGGRLRFDLLVNEMEAGRERRSG